MCALPEKKKRDKEASKQALLDAATAVFSERGYDAATTREVAKRAGVSEALIARYFEGKAGLLLAIMQNLSDGGGEEKIAALPLCEKLEDEIFQILDCSCGHLRDKSDFIRVALSRAIVDSRLGKQLGTHVHDRRLPLIRARLLHYQQLGQIGAGEDLNALAFSISGLGFALGFMAPEVFGFDRDNLKKIAVRVSRMLAHGASA